MSTQVLDKDKNFKPLKLMEMSDMQLILAMQGLEALPHDRQVGFIVRGSSILGVHLHTTVMVNSFRAELVCSYTVLQA